MAHRITIPFYSFRLHFMPGLRFLNPLRDKDTYRLGTSLKQLARQYETAFQEKVLNEGQAMMVMDEWSTEDFIKDELEVSFPASKDGVSYPAFTIEFEYYFQKLPTGFWGVVPVLGLEAVADELPQLIKNLQETIKIDYARKRRLGAVQKIISTIWFSSTELLAEEMKLLVPEPGENLKAKSKKQEPRLLSQVAHRLKLKKRQLYGREKELEQFEQSLKSSFTKNVLLVGPSGVGKTALVWEMSRQLRKRKIRGYFWETTASNMIKELTRDTGWEYNLAELCMEFKQLPHDYLYIRNLMDLFEVGKYIGNTVSMADYLLPYISKGEIRILAECTDEELARIELQSTTYTSNFQIIRLEEPKEELEDIILNKVKDIAQSISVDISEEAIQEVIRLNRRFTPNAGMPGRPIRFLESIILNKHKDDPSQKIGIGRSEVIEHFCEDTGMPRFMVDPAIAMIPDTVKKAFNENVFGQELAVESVVDALAAVKTGLNRSGRPIASFLFVGPTGVGKTELAKILAGFMFGNRNRMLRFDMSEYSNTFSVMRLIGDAQGEGQLTAAIRREPFSVLLFDEIEKADPTFYDLLLQVLSEGRLTDNRGNLANFCSAIIIMTSNIGAASMQWSNIGWKKMTNPVNVIDHFDHAVRMHFRPELYARIDKIIPFQPLDRDTIRFVVDREIKLFLELEGIKFRKIDLEIEPEFLDYLAESGYNNRYGARYLQRAIREKLIIPLAHQLNLQEYDDQLLLKISMQEEMPLIQAHADELALELLIEELNKIKNADYASFCRRKTNQFMEGYYYTMLLQELDRLTEVRKRVGERNFWDNKTNAEKITNYMEFKDRGDRSLQEINAIENELALTALGHQQYSTFTMEALEEWETTAFELKLDLFAYLNPKANTCHFAIYGPNPVSLMQFYLQLFNNKGYNATLHSIWYREAHFHQLVPSENGTSEKRQEYIKVNISDLQAFLLQNFLSPPKENDLLVGIECTVYGQAAFTYLELESGVFSWYNLYEEKNLQYKVEISNAVVSPPLTIHRKDFLKKVPARRSFNPPKFKDNHWKINREISADRLLEFLEKELDIQFQNTIEREVG